ncbi:MAG: UbiH/UbiF family hydroxylase [Pseudomonadota bacterium]
MSIHKADILVSGGGIAGLAAAAAFGASGFDVICVDPTPPVTDRDAEGSDLRSTALLQPARQILTEVGIWDLLAPFGTPLEVMRIVDAGGETPEPRVVHDFRADEISDLPFGWNFPNWLLRRELLNRLDTLRTVTFCPGIGTHKLFTRTGAARVTLTDGTRVQCKLLIAADGRHSPMRMQAGIDVRKTSYGQKALAFVVTHDVPHHHVSTEIHRTGGPFTLVPLPDHDGRASSAIVWMEDGPRADALYQMDVPAFEAEMTARSCNLFGPLKLATRRTIWPIISQHATRLTSERLALMAEAAHVLPPIGAQGLNMSLRDLGHLLELARKHGDALGEAAMLDAYARARKLDISLRMQGINLLNRASQVSAAPLRDARALGLDALYKLAPVRRSLMQMGLGVR